MDQVLRVEIVNAHPSYGVTGGECEVAIKPRGDGCEVVCASEGGVKLIREVAGPGVQVFRSENRGEPPFELRVDIGVDGLRRALDTYPGLQVTDHRYPTETDYTLHGAD